MLSLLRIKNVALIDEITVEFGPGLNLLTGETGSGKSIIVDSLGALAGDRMTVDIVKQSSDTAEIEGEFRLSDPSALKPFLDNAGIDIEDDSLIIRREITTAGKNRVYVNGRLTTLTVLRSIGEAIVAIHGQGEHSAVYDVEKHIEMLDAFAGVSKEKAAVSAAYQEWNDVRAEIRSLEKDASEKLQLIDMLKFQVKEISDAAITAGEDDDLEEEKLRLTNVEKLTSLSEEAFRSLYDSDDSTLSTLDRAIRNVRELSLYERRFAEHDEGINTARAVIEELAAELRDFYSKLEFSPDRINEIEERLVEITRLKRKYGPTIADITEHLRASEKRLENVELAEFRRDELQKLLTDRRAKYEAAAANLTKARTAAAKRLSARVEAELKDLSMDKAKFAVEIKALTEEDLGSNGADKVEFYFSANPGEAVRPLAKIASGGEASRVMLVLQTASKVADSGTTAVFDEVDVGIGGRVAEAVGRKLKAISTGQQILCVTHQPQIASLADLHLTVEKSSKADRTIVTIKQLDEMQRVEEIARMLAGETVTEAARENAREMIASA